MKLIKIYLEDLNTSKGLHITLSIPYSRKYFISVSLTISIQVLIFQIVTRLNRDLYEYLLLINAIEKN